MRSIFKMQHAIHKSFWAALLLTADARYAEDVITASIRSFEPEELSTDDFYLCVLTLSVRKSRAVVREQGLIRDSALSTLPPELQAVLKLPLEERHHFVLRILLGLADRTCALLLQTEPYTSTEGACDAVEDLAVLAGSYENWGPAGRSMASVA